MCVCVVPLHISHYHYFTTFKALTAVMFQVGVFWFVTPYIVVVRYQRFRGPCCLHLKGEVAGMGENGTTGTSVVIILTNKAAASS
jgi:hypothetical protein